MPKLAYHKTTQSFHRFHRHPNLLKPGAEQITATAPEHVWVADITYLPARNGPLYLSLFTDAYSRKIVGHHVHEGLHAESVAVAVRQALRGRRSNQALIHHSDRGIQYCSALYQALHRQHRVQRSMTDGYDCYQNALAERVNGILKNELLLRICSRPERWSARPSGSTTRSDRIWLCNTKRPMRCTGRSRYRKSS